MAAHPEFAFCLPAVTASPSAFISTSVTPRSACIQRPALYRILPPRRAVSTTTPTCVYNGGGGGGNFGDRNGKAERVTKQVVEAVTSGIKFLQSPSGQIVLWIGLIWLVLTGRIGFIFESFLYIFLILSITPVLAVFAFRWYVGRKLVQVPCPNCGTVVTGIKGKSFPCTACGTMIYDKQPDTSTYKDPTKATIDIDAKQIDD